MGEGPKQLPDYLRDLIDLASTAETQRDLDDIMRSAQRVATEAHQGRQRMRKLRQVLIERAVIIG